MFLSCRLYYTQAIERAVNIKTEGSNTLSRKSERIFCLVITKIYIQIH